MDCLAQFGLNVFTDVCLHALAHLSRCAHWLGNGHSVDPNTVVSSGEYAVSSISSTIVSPTPSFAGDTISVAPQTAAYHVDDSSSDLTVWLCTLRAMAQMV